MFGAAYISVRNGVVCLKIGDTWGYPQITILIHVNRENDDNPFEFG